jgi:hypothetical protein
VPARCERAGFGLAVSDHAGDQELGVVERRTEGVRERVPELAAFVDRPRSLRRGMAGNPSRERELSEELAQPLLVAPDVGVDLAVRPLEIGIRNDSGTAVSRTRDVDRIQVARADGPVQVDVDEIETRGRPEVAEQARLDVLGPQRLAK